MSQTPESRNKIAVIAGAGPAGLTAALELLRHSGVVPIVFDMDAQVGGISKTINYRGNRMDLGGHRFFSKSDWVMRWWQDILPVAEGQGKTHGSLRINYQQRSHQFTPLSNGPTSADAVMLVRQRLSRIFYRRRFFDYPLTLNASTLRNLGVTEAMRIALSYGRAHLRRRPPEVSLEDFLINRFGRRLYRTFFKDYTEKVWGVSCEEISAEWGAQRIKGLSISKAVGHAVSNMLPSSKGRSARIVETSLIEQFLYPKLGPGQMWEEVARRVTALGGTIHLDHRVVGVDRIDDRVNKIHVLDMATNEVRKVGCDYFISTMPVKDLISFLSPENTKLLQIAADLPYRDFMTAGLLLRCMRSGAVPPDNWIYIQDPDVRIGRLQVFNNWSPALVADPHTIWLGLEYFCREGDHLWAMPNAQFLDFAAGELEAIGLIDRKDVIDGTVERVPKAYPAYFGAYSEFKDLRLYLDQFSNLYPIGRNGMHRYNNQDHSMLTAKAAVEAITRHSRKAAIWDVNTDDTYHEESVGADELNGAVARW
jgi:protoporphyrinogen oxidase